MWRSFIVIVVVVVVVMDFDSTLQKKPKKTTNLCGFALQRIREVVWTYAGGVKGQARGSRVAESQQGEECRGQTEDPQPSDSRRLPQLT